MSDLASTRPVASPEASESTQTSAPTQARTTLALIALALGGFAIGTTEFASMGLLPQIGGSFGVDVTTSGHAITAYALGVVIGAPLFAVLGARLPRKLLLLLLVAMLGFANLSSALVPSFDSLLVARFASGLPHGAFFGIAAVVAASLVPAGRRAQAIALTMTGLMIANVAGVPATTWLGQQFGWRSTYLTVFGLAVVTFVAISLFVPHAPAPAGAKISSELAGLKDVRLWLTLLIGAVGFGGLFSVYSYVAPLLTEETGLGEASVPLMLVLIGVGMTLGNLLGGRLADHSIDFTIGAGFAATAVVLLLVWATAGNPVLIAVSLFLLGFVAVSVGPAVTARLMSLGDDGKSLAASLHHSAFNIANALGAWLGGLVIAAGLGYRAPAAVGFLLAALGLAALGLARLVEARLDRPATPVLTLEEALERMYAFDEGLLRKDARRAAVRQAPVRALDRFARVALSFTPSPL